jgi:hypothetical protein
MQTNINIYKVLPRVKTERAKKIMFVEAAGDGRLEADCVPQSSLSELR